MQKLTEEEQVYNRWWLAQFDGDEYKTISLIDHGHVVHRYGTANARYTDAEDAECAFFTAAMKGIPVTCVAVGVKRYKKINGQIRRIANMEVTNE